MDKAVERRLILLPFLAKFVAEPSLPNERLLNKNKGKDLLKNINMFFIWLLKGSIDYYQFGLGDFPDVMKEAKTAYYKDNDDIGTFFEACCDLTDPEFKTSSVELFEAYKLFMGIQNGNIKTFIGKMTEKGYQTKLMKKDGVAFRGYKGIKLN